MPSFFHFGAFSGGEPLPIVSILFVDDLTQSTTRTLDALVDTGADGTLVPLKILQDAGFRPNRQRRRFFTAQTEQPPEVVMGYSVSVQIGDLVVDEVDIYGSRTVTEVILGRNVLNRMVFTYHGPQKLLEVLAIEI